MKKFFALCLALSLLLSVLPAGAAAADTDSEDIWETINEIEDQTIRRTRSGRAAAKDFAGITDELIAAVKASDSYKKGTLERHGSFFFWETLDGEPQGYSPRLRAEIRNNADPAAELEAYAETETVSYAKRNGPENAADVAVFQPYYGLDSSFTAQYKTEGESIAKASGGSCTTYRTTDATIDQIADALESCAVVIFDSHGDTDYYNPRDDEDFVSQANTSYLLLQTNTGWTAADQRVVSGTYGSYYHAYSAGSYGRMRYYCVDGTAITNHMEKSAPNNFLWMAICLGMATDGLNAPLREAGVGVVYGYSQSVSFDYDYDWEEVFWGNMKNGKTVSQAISAMKSEVGKWDYCSSYTTLAKAQKNYCAFPIVVSAEDAYPGKGNVDNLQTVYSTWTLKQSEKPTYYFTAQSSNTAYGTVSVSGNTITPVPKVGCEVCGYSVSPEGAATVTKNGTAYIVSDLTANCTITIQFRQKACEHKTTELRNQKDASCTEAGYSGDTYCISCGDLLAAGNVIPALGHDYIDHAAQEVTCTEIGWAAYRTCARCDYSEYKELPALGHDYDEGVCTRCGAEEPGYVHICPCDDYDDLYSGEWYHSGVDRALKKGWMNGMGERSFNPNGSLTRAMLVTILYRIEGSPKPVGKVTIPFEDVPAGQWYTDAVIWAAKNKLVNGVSDTLFAPDAAITREQIAVILYRYRLSPEAGGSLSAYPDAWMVSSYAVNAMAWAVGEGIINGNEVGLLAPKDNATRAQIAMILYRCLKQ